MTKKAVNSFDKLYSEASKIDEICIIGDYWTNEANLNNMIKLWSERKSIINHTSCSHTKEENDKKVLTMVIVAKTLTNCKRHYYGRV